MMTKLPEVVELALAYCGMIESMEDLDEGSLHQLSHTLSRLFVALEHLQPGRPQLSAGLLVGVDLDARFELFAHLRRILGARDSYWMDYDGVLSGQDMSGSLADDLTDIYCELKQGLKLLDEAPERAVDCWCQGFYLHWGDHLVDATRHLYKLRRRQT